MVNTLLVAMCTATVAVGLTFLAGWLAVRRTSGSWLVDRESVQALKSERERNLTALAG